VNAVDDSSLKMGDWFDRVADTFGLPRPPRLPRAELAERVSPVMLSFMSESRRLSNRRLKRELRARLRWPTVDATLAEVKKALL
ncbi:MAG TPA: SDR family NAD(P)-dependent oxidoreductase, partial [Rubrivivax sp.]|nr:SDR family NAD(P)-dependent oxidoreductase [Rubrivivax sp.]